MAAKMASRSDLRPPGRWPRMNADRTVCLKAGNVVPCVQIDPSRPPSRKRSSKLADVTCAACLTSVKTHPGSIILEALGNKKLVAAIVERNGGASALRDRVADEMQTAKLKAETAELRWRAVAKSTQHMMPPIVEGATWQTRAFWIERGAAKERVRASPPSDPTEVGAIVIVRTKHETLWMDVDRFLSLYEPAPPARRKGTSR